jgi:hypothetical protein
MQKDRLKEYGIVISAERHLQEELSTYSKA